MPPCPSSEECPQGGSAGLLSAALGLRRSSVPLPRTSSQGLCMSSDCCAGGRRGIFSWKDSTLIYFFGQMAELCDPWSLFQLHTVRKQLFGKSLWSLLI